MAARKVNTPQAVAWGFPCRWAWEKMSVDSPASIATAIRTVTEEGAVVRIVAITELANGVGRVESGCRS